VKPCKHNYKTKENKTRSGKPKTTTKNVPVPRYIDPRELHSSFLSNLRVTLGMPEGLLPRARHFFPE
jgi:hypothetical protein